MFKDMIDHRISYKLKCSKCGTDVIRKVFSKKPVCDFCKSKNQRKSVKEYQRPERELVVYGSTEFEGYEFGNDIDKLGLSLHQEWIIEKDIQALKILIKLLLKEYEENS